jgi:adenylate cyclase
VLRSRCVKPRCAICGGPLAKEGAPCAACAHVAPRLVWHGPAGDAEWVVAGRTTIGRARGCTVRLPADREASKEHAAVEPGDGKWVIRDLASSNGTFVNGRRVRDPIALADGDEIRIGATRLRFRCRAEGSAPAPRLPEAAAPRGGGGVTVVTAEAALIASTPVEPERRFRPVVEMKDAAALRRDYEKLRIAHESHRALGGARDPAAVCEKVLDLALAALPADAGAVLLRRGHGGRLEPAAHRGPPGDPELLVSETLLARVLAVREAVLSADALADTFLGEAKSIVSRGVRSLMAVPLVGATQPDEVRGVLVLENRRLAGAFEPKDLDLLAAVAAQAGIALENAVLAGARDRLARFLPPPLVEEAARGAIDVGRGSLVEATLLFADLRGFTSLAERLAPEATVLLLNAFFEAMVEEVFAADGILDKYLGDGLMAIFGAPVRADDAGAGAALRCAVRMQARLSDLNNVREAAGDSPLAIGVGIDTGAVVVGPMGYERRLDYTAIGDSVNVAARLCAAAAPGEILCGAETAARAPGGLALEAIAPLEVKGKARPVRAFRARPDGR